MMADANGANGVKNGTAFDFDALVVGAGFGGCYLLHLLRQQGLKVKVLEAGATLGGVWCWSHYPGARVDCEFPYYGFSDPAIWNTWEWTERFPSGSELRAYFEHVAKVWDLRKDISFNTRVVEAKYEGDSWITRTGDGQEYRSKWFLPATGTSFKPYVPEWKGQSSFKGPIYHSSIWPETGAEIEGKRVAIIGAGSTGLQVMQEAGKVSSSVTQFIRTPNLAVPMRQRKITTEEVHHHRPALPHVFQGIRNTRSGLPLQNTGRKTFDDTPAQREALWEEQWLRGGFNWGLGSYADIGTSKTANRAAYDFWAGKTRARITDPQKRNLLAPLEPPYWIGTKRPSLEQDYFEMCDKPHVEITNSPIQEIQETGILAEDKFREFDVIAICTGYDAITGGLKTMGIQGRDGLSLHDKWSDGVYTNIGLMVHGFPNMYIVYGPQAPTSISNGPTTIEIQCEWVNEVIKKQREQNLPILESSKAGEDAWREQTLKIANMTLAVQTNSWYMGANVPGKKREYLLFLGGIPAYRQACADALEGWKGFEQATKQRTSASQSSAL